MIFRLSKYKFIVPLLLSAAAFGLYWPALHYAPFFDDFTIYVDGQLQAVFQKGFVLEPRWLTYFTMAWIDLLFKDTVFVQRFINVVLHLVTGYVLYALVWRVADHVAPHPNNKRAAIAAALLFLLHPLATYAVGYLIQRTILMATLFGLLSLNTFFDGLVTRKKAYFGFSALFYLLAILSKEHAVLIPIAAFAMIPLAVPMTRQNLRLLILPITFSLPIALVAVVWRYHVIGALYEPYAAALIGGQVTSALHWWGLSVLTQVALYFKYVLLMLLPYPGWMSIDMRVPFAMDFLQPKYWVAVLALAVYVATSLRWLFKGGRSGLAGFALLAPLLLFGVEFAAVRIQEPFVLYRSYLWLPPLFLLMPVVSNGLSDRLFWAVVVCIALAFGFASSDRLHSFSSGYALWDDAVRKLPAETVPGTARVYYNRGVFGAKRGELKAAIADFDQALQADPRYADALKGRAFAYMKLGDYVTAMKDAQALISLDPKNRDSYIVRGQIYKWRGDLDLAIVDFKYGCEGKDMPKYCLSLLLQPLQTKPEIPVAKPQ